MKALPSCFLPSIPYILEITNGASLIYTSERYIKQTFRNRCILLSANGPTLFTLPVEKYTSPAPVISEIKVSEHGNWRHRLAYHLKSTYRTAPFWDHYQDPVEKLIWDTSSPSLIHYNHLWLSFICAEWDIPIPALTSDLSEDTLFNDSIAEKESLASFSQPRYWQLFENKNGYLSGLSSIDLLLHEGPYAITYINTLR